MTVRLLGNPQEVDVGKALARRDAMGLPDLKYADAMALADNFRRRARKLRRNLRSASIYRPRTVGRIVRLEHLAEILEARALS